MEPATTSSDATPDLIVREPAQAELERVLYLFRKVPFSPETRLLAAVRSRPVERFVAALAWWPDGSIARFRLACQPGVDRAALAGRLIERLTEGARLMGLQTLEYAELLAADHEWAEVLGGYGFERSRSERSFEVAYRDAWTRVMRLRQKHGGKVPSGWRTDAIGQHPPDVILDLIAPYRLMPPAEICRYWRADTAGGFDRELSCILFDGERPFGAFLARLLGETIYIDVQVVHEANPRLRSLADLCLLYHDAQRVPPDGPIRHIQFRSGTLEHRQTANLALRMRGREVARRHVFSRGLAAAHEC